MEELEMEIYENEEGWSWRWRIWRWTKLEMKVLALDGAGDGQRWSRFERGHDELNRTEQFWSCSSDVTHP